MKIWSSVWINCCTALMASAVPLTTQGASKTLVLTDAEPQYASKLCWAAADVLAVNNFYPHCPQSGSTQTTTPSLYPTSQALEAANNWKTIAGSSSPLSYYLSNCENAIGNCNFWGWPLLHGLTFKWGTDPTGLDWATMKQEIDGGRPVLFVWNYPTDGTDDNSPVGKHELVVIGYSDDTGVQQLQIWDPWPVPETLPSQVPACGPATGVQVSQTHSQTIDFSTYSDPVSDMGVTAVHDKDQWALTMVVPEPPVLTIDSGSPGPAPEPSSARKPSPLSRVLPSVSFARALTEAVPASRQILIRRSDAALLSIGIPFPIVGLDFRQLLHAEHDPTGVLTPNTSAILVPVESKKEVVDAFLMLWRDGRWQRGGYANIEITRRLVAARAAYAAKRRLPLESFYMVSVPGEVAFFAAHGYRKKAILIPASTDPSIDAVAGQAVLADRQLKKLIVEVQQDLQQHPNRGRNTTRPNGRKH